jgi:hypothetical protein
VVATIMNLIVVGLALFVVRPLRLSTASKQSAVGQLAE